MSKARKKKEIPQNAGFHPSRLVLIPKRIYSTFRSLYAMLRHLCSILNFAIRMTNKFISSALSLIRETLRDYRLRCRFFWIWRSVIVIFIPRKEKPVKLATIAEILTVESRPTEKDDFRDHYVSAVRKKINKYSLDKHINIHSVNNSSVLVSGEKLGIKAIWIIVKNLKIEVAPRGLDSINLDNLKFTNQGHDFFLFEFRFSNCAFRSENQEEYADITFKLGEGTVLYIYDNDFRNTEIVIQYPKDSWHNIQFSGNYLHAGGIEFNKPGEPSDEKIKLPYVKDRFPVGDMFPTVYFTNNIMDFLTLSSTLHTQFRKANGFREINTTGVIPEITWNPYQKISLYHREHSPEIQKTKIIFLELRGRAQRTNNNFQEIVVNGEIAKLDHQMLKSEGRYRLHPDRIIFGWSHLISNYGSSWLRPMVWLLLVNALIATLGTMFSCEIDCSIIDLKQWSSICVDLLIPFDSVLDVFGLDGKHPNRLKFSVLNVTHKALYAALLYEIIKSFRRFARRENN